MNEVLELATKKNCTRVDLDGEEKYVLQSSASVLSLLSREIKVCYKS